MKQVFLSLFILGTLVCFAQNKGSIAGIVSDVKGEPIPFANITVIDSGKHIISTSSDFDGKFILKPLDSGRYTLEYSSLGFRTLQVKEVTVKRNEVTYIKNRIEIGAQEKSIEQFYNDSMAANKDNFKVYDENFFISHSPANITKTTGNGVFVREVSDSLEARKKSMYAERGEMTVRCGSGSVVFIDGIRVINPIGCKAVTVPVKISGISAEFNEVPLFKSNTNREVLVGKTEVIRYD